MTSKSWSDLTKPQQATMTVLATVQLGLLVAALFDIYKRPPEQINGSKSMWALLSLIDFVGPIAYFMRGRKRY